MILSLSSQKIRPLFLHQNLVPVPPTSGRAGECLFELRDAAVQLDGSEVSLTLPSINRELFYPALDWKRAALLFLRLRLRPICLPKWMNMRLLGEAVISEGGKICECGGLFIISNVIVRLGWKVDGGAVRRGAEVKGLPILFPSFVNYHYLQSIFFVCL